MSFGIFILYTIIIALVVWYAIANIVWAIRGEGGTPWQISVTIEAAAYLFTAYTLIFAEKSNWQATIFCIYFFFLTNVILAQWIACSVFKAIHKRAFDHPEVEPDIEPSEPIRTPDPHFNDVAYRAVDLSKLMQGARDTTPSNEDIYRWGLDSSVTVISPKTLLDKLERWAREMGSSITNRSIRAVIFNNLHYMYFIATDEDDIVMGIKVIPTDDPNYAHYILPVYYWNADAKRFFTKNIGLATFVGNGVDELPASLMKCKPIIDAKALYQYIKERFL